MPSIRLAAGARIVQAPGLPPAPAPGACRAALQSGAGHGPQFVAAAPSRAGARRFNRARAHISGTGQNSRGSRPRPAHAAEPPGPLHLHGHFGKLAKSQNFGFTNPTLLRKIDLDFLVAALQSGSLEVLFRGSLLCYVLLCTGLEYGCPRVCCLFQKSKKESFGLRTSKSVI